jgi:hypothetical protein
MPPQLRFPGTFYNFVITYIDKHEPAAHDSGTNRFSLGGKRCCKVP